MRGFDERRRCCPNPVPHFRPFITYTSANSNVSNMSIVFPQIICFFAAISVTSRRPFVPVEVKFCTKRDGSGGERLNKCGFCSLCDAFRKLPHAVRVTSSNILHICSCRIQIIPFLNGSGQSAQSSVQVTTASGSNHVRCAFSSLLCPPFTC